MDIKRIYVGKKTGLDVEGTNLLKELREQLHLDNLEGVRILTRYDLQFISKEVYEKACTAIFAEAPIEFLYEEEFPMAKNEQAFAMEYLLGQYDQREDATIQCIQAINPDINPLVEVAKVFVLAGSLSREEVKRIKQYCINPVDGTEASFQKPETLEMKWDQPEKVAIVQGFIDKKGEAVEELRQELGLAMTLADFLVCQEYFASTEKRDPSITEIRVLDTYWSDHCRHTTFLTEIEEVEIEKGHFTTPIEEAYQQYLQGRVSVYEGKERPVSLMDLALMAMKELRKEGKLADLEVSDEINACSIITKAMIDGEEEEWLVMFKNETHNHPTEIEPFGGAATCLGGAIRDPLSGRSYVYQAMRITGSGDPRAAIEDTLAGKLPQRTITTTAAKGYSSYGNQIGLATGQVAEIYDEGYVAKRMELGAVMAAAPRKNVVRGKAEPGDIIVLLGGPTGRDGCGGATGSSKAHTEESIHTCGAEVQKGNAPMERKIQRLFRDKETSRMIKKSNDFGAGGVSVAIGELADGLEVNLDAVPTKYEGLDGTELAISESQERMAVVLDPKDVEKFIKKAEEENLEATVVAVVTENPRLRISWQGELIVDLAREFLDTNGSKQYTTVVVTAPEEKDNYFNRGIEVEEEESSLRSLWLENLKSLNVCSQKGLMDIFDSTAGGLTVLHPYGGKYQMTPAEGMVAKLPVLHGETSTGTIMTYGYNPTLSKWSPFHGALYAVVEAVSKVVAIGGDYRTIRLTLQEYFERLGADPKRWGKPFSAVLGAYYAQRILDLPAIGGKDSMSGSFHELDVPPTLVAFAVNVVDVEQVISPDLKEAGHTLVYLPVLRDEWEMPKWEELKSLYGAVNQGIKKGKIVSAHTVGGGGLAEALSKMSFGNQVGIQSALAKENDFWFAPAYGSLVVEMKKEDVEDVFAGQTYEIIGETTETPWLQIGDMNLNVVEAMDAWSSPLESVFPTKAIEEVSGEIPEKQYVAPEVYQVKSKIGQPKVFIPIFPGTNGEYEVEKAFREAGGRVETFVFKNSQPQGIKDSIEAMEQYIRSSQIVALPGGMSTGDEPAGAAKFITTLFRNPRLADAVMDLLENRDGLLLGIGNGFQALMKLGLVPYGEIRELTNESPTITTNTVGRHMATMVQTKVASNKSPWLAQVQVGDIHTLPVSSAEGRIIASPIQVQAWLDKGQIATQYVGHEGKPTYELPYNPFGSYYAIEGLTSPDGRVLGKMGHSERIGKNVNKNIPGDKDQKIFRAGVQYFL
ncbi:MAG: phosphoribosylformylglycinamidine synthase [Epulopiscium sp.]|nr:phosphoribosylformylglycinamidine synthase [Candidatus Epulonipiscium sp.]